MNIHQKTVLIVFGTRPEAIKMAPLVKEFCKELSRFNIKVCVTGQHREMLDQVLKIFDIVPDYDLNIMKKGQDLYDITCSVLIGMRDVLNKVKPDVVLVHGDTTTSTAAALAAFYQQSYDNLRCENVRDDKIFVTGNTVIDALQMVVERLHKDKDLARKQEIELAKAGYDINRVIEGRRLVLITGHRRENFGQGFINIVSAIRGLTKKYPEVDFVYPMHLNPNVRKPIHQVFGEKLTNLDNMFFIEPLQYLEFVYLMQLSTLVLTDSGGIQEEAPGLGKPVLVMRNTTERPEAVVSGTVKLVGTDYHKIVDGVSELLENENVYLKMSTALNPYGDGKACERIVSYIKNILKNE